MVMHVSHVKDEIMYFPTICVDNFLNNPDRLREYALSLDYYVSGESEKLQDATLPEGTWPGKRTKPLHLIYPELFENLSYKIFSCLTDISKNSCEWELAMYFQSISPNDTHGLTEGWIHQDGTSFYAGLIYLTPNAPIESGTSIYALNNPKSGGWFDKVINEKKSYRDQIRNYNENDRELYLQNIKNNNSNFTETLKFGNVYNRLIGYDGKLFHSANNYNGHDMQSERLTLVFFVGKFASNWFPIPNSRQYDI